MSVKNFINTHNSEVYTGCAVAGLITSVILSAKATLRAAKRIEKKKEELGVEKLNAWETMKAVAPCYILTVVTMGVTTYAIVTPVNNVMKRNSILATGLMISEEARRNLEEATQEVVGERKMTEIRDKMANDKYEKTPVAVVRSKKPDEYVFVDTLTNSEFYLKSSSELDLLEKDMELDIVNYNFVSVNEWLSRLNIPPVDPAIGNLGWGPANGFALHRTWRELDNGDPCCIVDHLTPPLPRDQAEGCWGA